MRNNMLTTKEKTYLKSLAQKEKATFQIGKEGLSENLLTDVLNYLNSQLGYLERKYRKVVALHFKTGYGEELVEGTKIRENIKFPTVNAD